MENLIGRNDPGYKPKDDYFTPKYIFDALKTVFDLDVAAPIGGNTAVPSIYYFDIHSDGLKSNWFGKVWMNPPFSAAKPWVEKFIEHNNGIALLPTSKAKWFELMWAKSEAIVLLDNQLKFVYEGKKNKGIFMPCMLFAMGSDNAEILKRSGLSHVR